MNSLYDLMYGFWSSFFAEGQINADLLELVSLVSVFLVVIGLIRFAVGGFKKLISWGNFGGKKL